MSQTGFRPPTVGATEPFWTATRQRRLLLQYCDACDSYVHHPREACPTCLSTTLGWRESTGSGRVHAVSVHYKPFEVMTAADCPYAVGFVDLDEGVRFLANLVSDRALEDVAVGDPVRLGWRPIDDGYHLPVFHADAP